MRLRGVHADVVALEIVSERLGQAVRAQITAEVMHPASRHANLNMLNIINNLINVLDII